MGRTTRIPGDRMHRGSRNCPAGTGEVQITPKLLRPDGRKKTKVDRVADVLWGWLATDLVDIDMSRDVLHSKICEHFKPETVSKSTLERALRKLMPLRSF